MNLSAAAAHTLALQVVARCRKLATLTDVPGETTRTFLSPAMLQANARVGTWMEEAGLQLRIDAAGNLRGTLPGKTSATRFLIASHLDTVPNAGAFDGVLGVLLGIALAAQFRSGVLPFDLEIIGFSEEEGVRFGAPFLGSKALVGELDEALLQRKDQDGATVLSALKACGLNPDELSQAVVRNTLGYLEFHIEQGPAMEDEGLPVGVVETVAGQTRATLTFAGSANHAGTTPMHLRHDALAAAAAFIVAVEGYARDARGLVATVGRIEARPNAGNVIAGEVRVSLDVRSANDSTRDDAVTQLVQAAETAATARGASVATEISMRQAAVPLDRTLLRMLEEAVDENGAVIRRMVSGAGHDAMIVAPHMPAAMLFVRSPGGISHHPAESVRTEDVALALQAGYTFLQTIAARENSRA